jgi:thioredoxin-dependent peroxiredoxin
MSIRLGDIAPDFTAESTQGPISFHDYLGTGWGILFSHPKDFTPVCTTELGAASKLKPAFDARNTKMLALSVDVLGSHADWIADINATQHTTMNFPIIADADKHVATLYDMIHPNASDSATVRTVFIVGPDKKVKLTMAYPMSTGRNFAEILRALDALQLTAAHTVATPADWTDGQDVIVPLTVSDDHARTKYPKGVTWVRPYLRTTPQPNK